jgi:LPS sulfotransferase NodH
MQLVDDTNLPESAFRVTRHAACYALSLVAPLVGPRRRFVLFGTGRVGSELLMSLLDSHPDIVCDGEILTDERMLLPQRFIEWRALYSAHQRPQAFGFKVLTSQIRKNPHLPSPEGMFTRMARRGDLIIHMRRRNLLHVAVSFIEAELTAWHHKSGHLAAGPSRGPITVDPVTVLSALNALTESDRWNAEILAGLDHMTIVYEDDLQDLAHQRRTVDSIVSRLGLTPHPVSSDLVRVSPRRLQERLANFDEVASLIGNTEFAPYLSDGAPV